MDFELTDEQHALQQVIHELVDKECPPALVRAVVEGHDDGASFWSTLVGNEWTGLAVAEADGGSGASAVELVIALEQLGWGGDPTPFLATTSQYVPMIQASAGDDDQRHGLLQAVCDGRSGTVAFSADTVRAEPDGDGWLLHGTAPHVFDGDRADEVAVVAAIPATGTTPTTAATPGGLGVFVVPSTDLATTREATFDGSLHLGAVTFDEVRVRRERALLGPDGDGIDETHVAHAGQLAVTGLSAVMVGACQRVFDLVLDHVKQRKQFGVPIGSFQAVKHMAVDVYVAIERARALCQFAALTIAEGDERRHVAPSMAKAAAGDCQRLTAKHGIQLFGGLGFTWENDLQLYLKRAKAGELLLGTSKEHRARVARSTMADSIAHARAEQEAAR